VEREASGVGLGRFANALRPGAGKGNGYGDQDGDRKDSGNEPAAGQGFDGVPVLWQRGLKGGGRRGRRRISRPESGFFPVVYGRKIQLVRGSCAGGVPAAFSGRGSLCLFCAGAGSREPDGSWNALQAQRQAEGLFEPVQADGKTI
jgi:hypothetical protein